MADHLYDTWAGTWSASSIAGTQDYGATVGIHRTGQVTGLRYHRLTSSTAPPDSLALWSRSGWNTGPTLLERVTVPSPGSTTGWVDLTLSTPVDVFPDDQLLVTARKATTLAYSSGGFSGPARTPWTLTLGVGNLQPNPSILLNSTGGYVGSGTEIVGLDVSLDAVPFGDFTVAELTDEFARWLTAGGDKYPESDLPAIKGQAEGANANAQNAWTTAQQNQNDLGTLLGRWTQGLADNLGTAAGQVADWNTKWLATYDAFIANTSGGLADILDAIGAVPGFTVFGTLAGLVRFANGLDNKPYRDPATYYDVADEIAFNDRLAWPVQADAYLVELDSFDPAGTSEPYGPYTRYGYLGKWTRIDLEIGAEWHYFNTPSALLYEPGYRLPGLGLILYRPGSGTVKALTLKAV